MTQPRLSEDVLDGRAFGTPVRVQALHVASRILIVMLVAAPAVSIRSVVDAEGLRPQRNASPNSHQVERGREVVDVAPSSRMISEAVSNLSRVVADLNGELLEFQLDNPRGQQADIALRFEVASNSASGIPSILRQIRAEGIGSARVENVLGSPGGSRVVVRGSFVPSTGPRPRVHAGDDETDVSVRIAVLTSELGIELRQVDSGRADRDAGVRLQVAGTLDAAVELLGRVESGLSSPTRVRRVRLERGAASGQYLLELDFQLREPSPRELSGGWVGGQET